MYRLLPLSFSLFLSLSLVLALTEPEGPVLMLSLLSLNLCRFVCKGHSCVCVYLIAKRGLALLSHFVHLPHFACMWTNCCTSLCELVSSISASRHKASPLTLSSRHFACASTYCEYYRSESDALAAAVAATK